MSNDILVDQRDGIATVTFNRPDQRNAISYAMWLDLQRIAVDLETSPGTRVVVFRGQGEEAFSAGADIKDFEMYRNNSAKARVYASAVEGAMDALEGLTKPTLCLMKGYCVGGGFELTHACDLRIASDTAKVGITAARLGICIGYREMRRLVQLAGRSVAMDILLTGRLVDAAEALQLGLVSQVVEAACVEALEGGVCSADVVLNILGRRRQPSAPTTIPTPERLRLRHEPVADCGRYDRLRGAGHGAP